MNKLKLSTLSELHPLPGDALLTGEVTTVQVHAVERCEAPCAFHSPSDHPLKDAPLGTYPTVWGRVLVRVCDCGVRHPDPDFELYLRRIGAASDAMTLRHQCCALRCCQGGGV